MDLDEHALLLSITRANAVWRVPILNRGVAKVGTFIQLSGGVGPDGLALDSSGGLVIAHAGMGAVWVFNARGEPTYRVNTPDGNLCTNLAFGGPENRDIFITESRSAHIYRARVEVSEKVMVSHRSAG